MFKSLLFILSFLIISLNISYAGLWTRNADDLLFSPQFAPLKQLGQVTSFKVRIADNTTPPHPYAKTGLFFQKGAVTTPEKLIAQSPDGTEYPLQINPQNTYPDGSLRFAIVTVKIPKAQNGKIYDVILTQKQSSLSSAKQFSPKIPDITVVITPLGGISKNFSLSQALPEETPWLTGGLVDERRYNLSAFKGLELEFDIKSFENNSLYADIVFRYDRLLETPMQNASYKVDILVNNKPYISFDKITQNHHSKWRYPIRFGYKSDNITATNMYATMYMGALPMLDMSHGVSEEIIENDFETIRKGNNTIRGTGLLQPYFPTTGTRPDIGIIPQWTARYIITSDDRTRYIILKHAEIAAYIPWHFIDEKTQRPASPADHPKIWIDSRATLEKNGITPYDPATQDTVWFPDVAHQPSLVYVPYIITGDRYYYDTLKAIYMYNRLVIENTQNNEGFRDQYMEQVRSYGWFRRTAGEMQSILSQNDPDKEYIITQNKRDITFLENMFIQGGAYDYDYGEPVKRGKYPYITGELTGSLMGYGSDTGQENPVFMQDLAALGIGFDAGTGLNPELKNFSYWQTNFIAGRFLQENNGYNPLYGSCYKFIQYILDPNQGIKTFVGKISILNKWRDIFEASAKSELFKEATQQIQNDGIAGYGKSGSMFTAYARASNAQLFNVTRHPDALEAYGFLAQYSDIAEEDYHNDPAFLITPFFDNRDFLEFRHIYLGDSGDDHMTDAPASSLLHGKEGDDTLIVKQGSSFLFGGNGNDILGAGTDNSYLFGGSGSDTLISGRGNDILKGDPLLGKNKDIFKFTDKKFGDDVILDFTLGVDKIHFTKATGIRQFIFNNGLEGLAMHSRACPPGQINTTKNPCDADANISSTEFLKQIRPELPEDLLNYEKTLEIIRKNEAERTSLFTKDALQKKFDTLYNIEEQIRAIKIRNIYFDKYELQIQNTENYRLDKDDIQKHLTKFEKGDKDTESYLVKRMLYQTNKLLLEIQNIKTIITNKLRSDAKTGNLDARQKLRETDITNIGIKNYMRPSGKGDTIIDLNINAIPKDHYQTMTEDLGDKKGSILIKNILPEEFSKEDFIFSE